MIVCATPRSGSTLLCALLAASGTGGRPESWYRAEDRAEYEADWGVAPADAAGFLAGAIRAGSDASGTFGLRVQAASLAPMLAELRGLFGPLPDLELMTRAFGRCAFVFIRREDDVTQAVSRLKAEVSQVWHLDGTETAPRGAPEYDADRLDVRLLLDRVGLPADPGRVIAAPNRRMADATSAAWAVRYRRERGLDSARRDGGAL
jgi:LPS sulfotransferase NodH